MMCFGAISLNFFTAIFSGCRHSNCACFHDNVIKWEHFPRYLPFVRGIHRSPVNSPHKGQWRGALMFSLICVWINGRVNNREAGDLRRYRAHYDVTVMFYVYFQMIKNTWFTSRMLWKATWGMEMQSYGYPACLQHSLKITQNWGK